MTQYETRTPAELPERIRHYIDGEFVDSADGATFDVISPVTNETYIQASAGSSADIDRAVAAAQRTFDAGTWSQALPRNAHGCCTKSQMWWRPAAIAWPSWSPSTPACPSPRRWARHAGQQRTSGSSPI